MTTIDINEQIDLVDGTSYQFVSRAGVMNRLRNLATGDYVDMHIAELSQKCVSATPATEPVIRDFESLPRKKQEKTFDLADHIEELLTGVHPGRTEARPEYDLATTTQNQRIASKVTELNKAGKHASRATLHRRIKEFREFGPAALADKRAYRTEGPLDNVHPDVKDALCAVIADQKNRSTGTKKRLIDETATLLVKRFGADAPPLPSTASMYRYIEVLTTGKYTTDAATTRRSAANRPEAPYGQRTENLPGAEVQVDSTTMDVFVRDNKGKPVRPILTIMVDRATRLILAFTLRFDGTKGIDHVTLLAQALTPPQNRPDNSAFRHAIQRQHPDVKLLPHDERKFHEATRPFVHPRRVVMDNGRDYASKVFEAALQHHGIDISYSPPHTPTTKAIVERTFGSIHSLFTQHLPGYVGRSPEHKGYKVEDEGIMSIFALHELFDDWVLNVWNNRLHDSLTDRLQPSIKLTPSAMYQAASRLTSNLETSLTRDDYIAMLPTKYRTITSTGVAYDNRQFDSVELNPLRHTRSNVPRKGGLHAVKLDPYNPMYAWVQNPNGGWIECTLRNFDADLHPHLEDFDGPEEDERADLAMVTAAITGTPLHTATVESTATDDTTTPEDDEDDEPSTVVILD